MTFMKHSIMTAVVAGTLVWWSAGAFRLAAQTASTGKATASAVPRMADGHPDLSGVWWRGADIGGRAGGPRDPRPALQRRSQPLSRTYISLGPRPTLKCWPIKMTRPSIVFQPHLAR